MARVLEEGKATMNHTKELQELLKWILLYAECTPIDIKEKALQSLLLSVDDSKHMSGFLLSRAHYDEIKSHAENQRKIHAIKLFRHHTGAFLKDAKEAIEKEFKV